MEYVFDPAPHSSLAVVGSDARFPIRRVFCVGRNYAAHAREMGNDPDREPPFFFTKPADAVVNTPCTVLYPPLSEDVHHEVELVLAIGTGGAGISASDALDHIWGASVGIDLTRRDLQADAKANRRPWDMAKAFDASAPIAPIVPIADVPSLSSGRIWLSVNDVPRQDADIGDMIWPVPDIIAALSRAVMLAPGDLIMTGTPEGVGPVRRGDIMTGGLVGIGSFEVTLA
ncbi:MAG: fumarylacetoacetate hydrolase family protein [Pseudomonadota bacterium]